MGKWYTVHLFDYSKFEDQNLHNLLNNYQEFKIICESFLSLTPFIENGKSLPLKDKIGKVNELNHKFLEIIKEFNHDLTPKYLDTQIETQSKRTFLLNLYDYHFARFFNFLLFYKYSDFYPFVAIGKHGIRAKLKRNKSVAFKLLLKLDQGVGRNYFSIEEYGIVGWLSANEVKLLAEDFQHLEIENGSNLEGLLNLTRIAHEENLGLVLGVDMIDEKIYPKLPSKIKHLKHFNGVSGEGIFFEYK